MSNHIITQDLCCAAYFLTKGLKLQDLMLEKELNVEKKTVSFLFNGSQKKANKLLTEFRSGKAEVELAAFWNAYNYLKDELFQVLRKGGLA